jgi:photosystem II stability/assembly factor-like uncharacterized protein
MSLLYTPTTPPQVFVGRLVPQGSAARLLATIDTGRSWQARDADLQNASAVNHPVYSLARDPLNPNRLYLGTGFPILRSDDGGVRWRFVMGTGDQVALGATIVVSRLRTGLVIAGGLDPIERAWLYRSLDAGETWQSSQPFGLTSPAYGAPVVAFDPTDAAAIWAGTRDGLWHSADTGATWVQVRSTAIWHLYTVGEWVVAQTTGAPDTLLFTADQGSTWQALLIPRSADWVGPAAVDPSGALVLGSSSNGVWRLER